MPKILDPKLLNHETARHDVAAMVERMGFAWNDHFIEQGIDGVIELSKPDSNEALGKFIGAQIKTQKEFAAESSDQFSFYPDARDIEYWRTCNVPVVLLVCRPADHLYYGVHIQAYLADTANQGRKAIIFDKQRDAFAAGDEWRRRLLDLTNSTSLGLSFPPVPVEERLSSNLLKVHLPDRIYFGPTIFQRRGEVISAMRAKEVAPRGEFIIKESQLWSVLNLSDPVVGSGLVDPGAAKSLPFRNIAFHTDPAKRRYAVELLNQCLTERLLLEQVVWLRDDELYAYIPETTPLHSVRKPVPGQHGETKKGLIFPKLRKAKVGFCRHAAMRAEFVAIGEEYYLQINPTYCFTRDGHRQHARYEEFIRNARIMEKELQYFSNLQLWRSVLSSETDLVRESYEFLSFGDFLELDAPVSIPDDAWKPASDADLESEGQTLLDY